ncbi:MAG: M23 family metallopeptidase [Oscillospiraceae bacterium]|nr:M23 family metallopeptidase [Oscillospiraceae bacterium]
MQKKLNKLFGAGGPYIVFALCLVAAGILGYQFFAPVEPIVPEEPVLTEPAPKPAPAPVPVIEPIEPAEEESAEVAAVDEVEIPAHAVVPEEPRLSPDLRSPLEGKTIAAFSADVLFYNETLEDWRTHNGVDIAAEEGTPVCAACDGTVLSVTEDPLMGVTVVLEHAEGFTSTYACLSEEVYVSAGDSVLAGENIGAVGSTAAAESPEPHLHFSVSKDGKLIDPSAYLN